MIKVYLNKKRIVIKGHANYDDYGKDIVCASASAIVITSVNSCFKISKDSLYVEEKPNLVTIEILVDDKNVLLIIENMISMLQELAVTYKNNIKIIKEDEL